MPDGRFRAVASALVLLSCGSVGEPLPPLLNIPGAVEDLRVEQIADEIVVSWRGPESTTEGFPVKEIGKFSIKAMTLAAGAPVPSTEIFDQWGREVAARTPREEQPARSIVSLDVAPFVGERTAFSVQTTGKNGRVSPHPPFAILEAVKAPAAPAGLRAEAAPEGVRVQWDPVPGAALYRIVRREAGSGPNPPRTLNESASADWLDRSTKWGKRYSYQALAVVDAPTGPVPGPLSESVEITPRDVFPPAAPRDLRAVVTEESVELSWSPSPEPDLAGYRVLRDGKAVHDGLLADAAFSDREIEPGRRYRYTVEAEDHAGNRGAPSEAVEAGAP